MPTYFRIDVYFMSAAEEIVQLRKTFGFSLQLVSEPSCLHDEYRHLLCDRLSHLFQTGVAVSILLNNEQGTS